MSKSNSSSVEPLSMFVFVYGTLKTGEPNHHWISDAVEGVAQFEGIGKTIYTYPLVIASRYNIPYLLDARGQGRQVEGEVWSIDDAMLRNLDVLEDYPKHYTRREEPIRMDGEEDFRPCLLDLPYLHTYTSNGSHGLPYVERYQRMDPTYSPMHDVSKHMIGS
ncbi:unnamed protein product [Cyprideis torosa]|uniref:Gamma-glutamylcyclotransferase family protein n=1 Tax=Cyprideis torosa TaxID=163714 RepID=A0A7R8WQG5_9CRUS|nr:unnamed protein product [Cyprideis torosa]CAG0901733.1 unnamed protein product [Cyprideis torosa]